MIQSLKPRLKLSLPNLLLKLKLKKLKKQALL